MKFDPSALRGVDFFQAGTEYSDCRRRRILKSDGHQYFANCVGHRYPLDDEESLLGDNTCVFFSRGVKYCPGTLHRKLNFDDHRNVGTSTSQRGSSIAEV
jgi:hypothetical protein